MSDNIGLVTTVYIGLLYNFFPRDAMHKGGLCRHAVSVCVCVCVSVAFVDHVKVNKDSIEIVSPPSSHTILVFPRQTA